MGRDDGLGVLPKSYSFESLLPLFRDLPENEVGVNV